MFIRILIVGDRPQVRQGLRTVLELAGREAALAVIGEARSGLEALAQLTRIQPDVVLIDLEMPGMDGFETTRRLKACQPGVRVILISIQAGAEIQARLRAAGADGFVTKGDSYEVLLNAIRGDL